MKNAKNYLIAMVVVLITSLGAMAQGGLAPLVGSTHSYSITAGGSGNTYLWTVVEGSSPTDYVITNGGTTTASILWKTAGTYTLRFTESTASCSTVIENTVVVSGNTFDVSTPSPLSDLCNEASGVPNYAPATVATTVSFVVNMATAIPAWNPNWEFSFTLTPNLSTISSVVASPGTLTGTGPYLLTAATSSGGTGLVTITLELTGNVNDAHDVAFAITSAKELQYSTPDKDNDDWNATQIINPIPNTSSISTD